MSTPSSRKVALIVDDEESIRKYVRGILEKAGFSILEAKNGVDALDVILREGDRSIDLIISDVNMPEMDGMSLIIRVRKLFPTLPIILISGYDAEEMDPLCKAHERCTFLQKPFLASALIDTVQKLLDLRKDSRIVLKHEWRTEEGTMAWSGKGREKLGLELLAAMQTARDEYKNAQAESARMAALARDLGLETRDGGLAIHRAATANAEAMRALSNYQRAVRQYTTFVICGQVPKDEGES